MRDITTELNRIIDIVLIYIRAKKADIKNLDLTRNFFILSSTGSMLNRFDPAWVEKLTEEIGQAGEELSSALALLWEIKGLKDNKEHQDEKSIFEMVDIIKNKKEYTIILGYFINKIISENHLGIVFTTDYDYNIRELDKLLKENIINQEIYRKISDMFFSICIRKTDYPERGK